MVTSLQRIALGLLLAASVGVAAACGRGEDGASGQAGPPADAGAGGAPAAAPASGDADAADLPPQIVAEHPVPAPGAPAALRPGETVSFLDGAEAEPDGPRPALQLAVADLAVSAAFYAEILGFAVESTVPREPPYRRIELARDGVRLVLRRRDELAAELPPPAGGVADEDAGAAAEEAGVEEAAAAPDRPSSPAAFVVPAPDLDALLRRVEEAASGTARLGEAADGSRRLAVRDPDGHVLVFVEPLPPEPGTD